MCSPIKTPMTPNLKPAAGHTPARFDKMDGTHNFTPFKQVHLAKSGEIVNEMNMTLCSVEIDDVPQTVQIGNANIILLCLNNHAALVEALEALVKWHDVGYYPKYSLAKARAILATVKGEQVTKTT